MIRENLCFALVFLAEAIIAWIYFDYLFVRKSAPWRICISFGLGYLILFLISWIDIIALNTTAFFFINLFLLLINWHCRIKTAILQSAFLAFVMSMAEIIMALAISIFVNDYAAYTYNFAVMVALAVSSKLLYFFITIIAAHIFKPRRAEEREPSMTILLGIIPVASAIVAEAIIYIGMTSALTRPTELLITMSILALLFVNLMVLIIYNHIQKLNSEYTSMQVVRLKEHADAQYYKLLQEKYESQRVLVHDIKNHFRVLDQLAQDGSCDEIVKYISELENSPGLKLKIKLCDNPILNMILQHYAEYCETNGIKFLCDVRAGGIDNMDLTGITSLFGNLLSNAVEAAEVSEEKLIELSVIKNTLQDTVLISVVNSCDTAPKYDVYGKIRTRKNNPQDHGYGIKSIERIVDKYHGISKMYYSSSEKQFYCIIQLPI